MKPNHPPQPYYPALDGLRGLAILFVVFYHNFGFINYFFFGWLGVDLFFVLSGYLITDILLRAQERKQGLSQFYIRRILRIFPLYYLTLILFLVILPAFSRFQPSLQYYTDNQAWLWTYLQNWLYIIKPSGGTTILHHLWSLAVEEQFYILWPLAIFIIRKPKFLLAFIITVLITVLVLRCVVWINKYEDLAYFNLYTFSRIDGICIGCMVALLQKINSRFLTNHMTLLVFVFAGLNFIFYFINRYYHFSFPYLALIGYTTLAMLFGLLVYEAVKNENKIINGIFNWRLLKFFGKISYGFYIFHWPVYVLLSPFTLKWIQQVMPAPLFTNAHQIFSAIFCTGIAFLISVISYHFFEIHFLKLKNRFN
jgi:peptidoglycan/LPS O-acetylase OafA/YrhL